MYRQLESIKVRKRCSIVWLYSFLSDWATGQNEALHFINKSTVCTCNCTKISHYKVVTVNSLFVQTHLRKNKEFIPSRAFRSCSEGLQRVGLHVHDGSQIQDWGWTSRTADWNNTATHTAQFSILINC